MGQVPTALLAVWLAACLWVAVALLSPGLGFAGPSGERQPVAVLELASESKRVELGEVQVLTDMLRSAAARGLDPMRYWVMTREAMEVLVGPEALRCMAGECLVQIGRRLQATYVVGGVVKDFGTQLALTVEVYESRTGRLVDSLVLRDAGLESLGERVEAQAAGLMRRVTGGLPGAAGGSSGGAASPSSDFAPPPPPDGGAVQGAAPVRQVGTVAPELGRLTVEGNPKGARVDVTGPAGFGDKGKLATSLPFGPVVAPAGEYRVRVTAPGHDQAVQDATVFADRTAVVTVELEPSLGTIEVTGRPEGARVELACAQRVSEVFGLPGTLSVPRGPCRVQVTRNGYQPFERQVDVAGGKTVRVDVNLVQIPDTPPARAPKSPTSAAAAGTWRDPATGLTWQNPPYRGSRTWSEAKSYCASLSLAGGGWRLPTISELRSLIRGCAATQTGGSCKVTDSCRSYSSCWDSSCEGCSYAAGPANRCYWPDAMEGSCGWYWSSSPVADPGDYAFLVLFGYGHVIHDNPVHDNNVRCVR